MILKIMRQLQKALKGINTEYNKSIQPKKPCTHCISMLQNYSQVDSIIQKKETNNLFLKQSGNFQVEPGMKLTYNSLQTLKVEVLFPFKKVKWICVVIVS